MVPQPPLLHTPTSTSPSSLVGVGDTPQPPEDARELFFFFFVRTLANEASWTLVSLAPRRRGRCTPPTPPSLVPAARCRFASDAAVVVAVCVAVDRGQLALLLAREYRGPTRRGFLLLGANSLIWPIWNLEFVKFQKKTSFQFPRLTKDWHSGCPLSVLSKRTQRPSRKTTGRGCSEGVQGQGRRKSSASNRAACRPVEGPGAKSAREARRGKSFLHHL